MTRSPRRQTAFRPPSRPFDALEARRLLSTAAVSSIANSSRTTPLTVDYATPLTTLPTVSFSDAVMTEGRRGAFKSATLTVTLSHASSRDVAIGYKTQGGTATGQGPARDFLPISGTLTIKAGRTTGTIRIRVVGDNRAEADETFAVVATRVKNASLAMGASAGRVVIRDDDTAERIRPTLSVSSPTIVEGNAAAFVVSLSAASSRDVTVRYATEPGTALASGFSPSSGILTIPAGQTSATIVVPTYVDDSVTGPRTFSIRLSTAANADLPTAAAQGTATLLDAESGAPPVPSISAWSTSITEGDTGPHVMNFIVTLSAASAWPVTVDYSTVAGTATAGSDYTPASGTLTFAPGVTSLVVPVTITNDVTYEAQETFSLVLGNASGATLDRATATGTIFDNDYSPIASIVGVSAVEGNAGDLTPFTFTVTLLETSGVVGTVDYATSDGTAVAGRDYEAQSGTITFAPGVTSQTITIYVIGNSLPEPTRMFTVNLSNPINLKLAASTGAANGTILDDDPAVSVS